MGQFSRFSVVSTFSGGGGSSAGYVSAGGRVLLAVDNDASAMQTYRLNFPTTPVFCGDIVELSVAECCRLARIKPGELDILDGSPPCQGFSAIGPRRFTDARNRLVEEFARLLHGLQPKTCVLENVSGMVRGKMKVVFVDCLRKLKQAGYKVRARLLNTKYLHVPQDRQRIIFVGVRDDLVGVEPSHPRAQSEPQSLRDALGLHGTGAVRNTHFRTGWRSLDQPCVTIVARHPPILLLDGVQRPLTLSECSLLQGFPPDWKWGSKAYHLVGNAVPPPFMHAIAEHVKSTILGAVGTSRREPTTVRLARRQSRSVQDAPLQ